MLEILRRSALILLLIGWVGCSNDEGKSSITGPGFEPGTGRIYAIQEVTFPSLDGVPVSALFGVVDQSRPCPVVILIHDLGDDKNAWLSSTSLLIELLERGYMAVAIDLRGQGGTPLPDNRQVLLLEDLENGFLDVQAALNWLPRQPGADMDRIGLIGSGSGGNIAYVSSGIYPQRIKTAVSLSAGLWENETLQPVIVGAGLQPFGPRSILFMVGGQDVLSSADGTIVLSYVDFARGLAAVTSDPKSLLIFGNSADHGLELLNNVPEATASLLSWLEQNL